MTDLVIVKTACVPCLMKFRQEVVCRPKGQSLVFEPPHALLRVVKAHCVGDVYVFAYL